MESRIIFFSPNHAATQELFSHNHVKKHARVASIERMEFDPTALGFYGYNFFGGDPPVVMNSVWHLGDNLDDLESLFTDLSTFQGHTLVS